MRAMPAPWEGVVSSYFGERGVGGLMRVAIGGRERLYGCWAGADEDGEAFGWRHCEVLRDVFSCEEYGKEDFE